MQHRHGAEAIEVAEALFVALLWRYCSAGVTPSGGWDRHRLHFKKRSLHWLPPCRFRPPFAPA